LESRENGNGNWFFRELVGFECSSVWRLGLRESLRLGLEVRFEERFEERFEVRF
jgi:hypothetical protein